MRIVLYALVTGIAAVVTYGLAILIWKLSTKYRLYPKIRERDVHTRPTPRLGGVAMFLGMVVAFGVASQVPELSLVFSDAGKVLGILGAALIIVLIGVATGFSVTGGAEGVGRATTRAVVLSICAILVADMVFSFFLNR